MKKALLIIISLAFISTDAISQPQRYSKRYPTGLESSLEYKLQAQTNDHSWDQTSGQSEISNLDKLLTTQGLTFFTGYRINPNLFVAAGTGVDYTYSKAINHDNRSSDRYAFSMPVLARVKFNLLTTKVTPYCSFDFGYNFNIATNYNSADTYIYRKENGFSAESTIGIEFNMNSGQSMYIGVVGLGSLIPKDSEIYNFYSFKLGLRF